MCYAVYKKDLHRIEDSIIPFILEGLLFAQIKQRPQNEKLYADALNILRKGYIQDLNSRQLLRRAERIEKKVVKYWSDNDYIIRKSIMVLSYLAAALNASEALILQPETQQLFKEINEIITDAYGDEDILKQDKSAAKQMPKILDILQAEGLY